MATKFKGVFMSYTQEEILNDFQEKIENRYPDMEYKEGNLCYDLTSPTAYVTGNSFKAIDNINSQLNILTANYDFLKGWAIPRIGEKQKGTNTIIKIEGNDINDTTWVLTKDNQYQFSQTEVNEENNILTLTADQVGYIPVMLGDSVISIGSRQTAKVTEIILGKNEETLENYRNRYINSLFIDSLVGTPSYYKEHIMMHEKVGYAGIDFESSKNYIVSVMVVGLDYLIMDQKEKEDVLKYFYSNENYSSTNIVPIGQQLQLLDPSILDVNVVLTIRNEVVELTEAIVRSYLENIRKTKYVPELFMSLSLSTNIDIIELRNNCVSQFSSYATVIEISLNDQFDYLPLKRVVIRWKNITIKKVN